MILAQLLRDHIAARKMSIRSLADEIGMDHNNLWRIVRGENTRADNVVKILAWMCSTPVKPLSPKVEAAAKKLMEYNPLRNQHD